MDFHLPGHSDVIFFGHTHVQGGFAYSVKDGKTRPILPKYPNTDRIAALKIELRAGRTISDQSGIGGAAPRQ